MKLFRISLLLLLALLLPLRSVLAGATPCSAASHAPLQQGEHPTYPENTPQAQAHPHCHGNAARHGEDSRTVHIGACSHCASFCTMAIMWPAPPTLIQPALAVSLSYPAFSAPEPTFLAVGPDRPPRSL